MKQEFMLLASAPTLDRIGNIIEKYFYNPSKFELLNVEPGMWIIITGKGKLDRFRVVQKRKRFRFEQLLDFHK